jgi:chemotaxis protein methyltransferase CheR
MSRLQQSTLNRQSIERGRSGIYGPGSLKELSQHSRAVYFESLKDAKRYAVKAHLRSNIDWKVHHLLTDPLGSNYNIIFMRNNILTYYRHDIQKRALSGILPCLSPDGLLVIGCHESLPVKTPALTPMLPFSYVFQIQGGVS